MACLIFLHLFSYNRILITCLFFYYLISMLFLNCTFLDYIFENWIYSLFYMLINTNFSFFSFFFIFLFTINYFGKIFYFNVLFLSFLSSFFWNIFTFLYFWLALLRLGVGKFLPLPLFFLHNSSRIDPRQFIFCDFP